MKKNRFKLWTMMLLAILAAGCQEKETHLTVEPDQLIGKWLRTDSQEDQEYWRYRNDYTGVTWNEAEDISEEESNLTFEWTLAGDRLTHVFRGEQGNQAVPKVYTITAISETTMQWRDDYSITLNFTKTE